MSSLFQGRKFVSIKDLYVSYYSYRGIVQALRGVFLDMNHGETIALVGETGCGKSTLGLAIVRLISPPGRIDRGQIFLEGEDLLKKSKEELREIRGDKIGMIFQDPTASLNPVVRIGDQVAEGIMNNETKAESMEKAVEWLSMVGMPDALKVSKQYPHELSGGMKQRVMIAIALSSNPKLLIADEPTSNLDVTIEAQILDLIKDLKEKMHMSILLITHDIGLAAQNSDKVAVMYAGKIVEFGDVIDVFKMSKHPYTMGLFEIVSLGEDKRHLNTIPGVVPDLIKIPKGCIFSTRCSLARKICYEKRPELIEIALGHFVACHLYSKQ